MQRLARYTGRLHLQLRRKLFFSHRDLDTVLDLFDKGTKFVLYTGRGPSGPVHIGHLVPWIFTKHLQDAFHTRLYFQMTDDEKFVIDDERKLRETTEMGYDNALDSVAFGFKPEDTFIIYDVQDIDLLYDIALGSRQAHNLLNRQSHLRVPGEHEPRLGFLASSASRSVLHTQETHRRKRSSPHPRSHRPGSLLANHPRHRNETRLLQTRANSQSLLTRVRNRRKNERV